MAVRLNIAAGRREGLWFSVYPKEIYHCGSKSIFSKSVSDANLEWDKFLPFIEEFSLWGVIYTCKPREVNLELGAQWSDLNKSTHLAPQISLKMLPSLKDTFRKPQATFCVPE